MAEQSFWMVKGRGPTNFTHPSRAAAEAEARRLARENPVQIFAVLEAVCAFRKIDVERIELRAGDPMEPDMEIPF